MALTPEEAAELAALEAKYGSEPFPEEEQEFPIQAQHPDVSFKDRFVAKNFANDIDAQIGYLKKQNPNLEVSTMQGQVVVRKPGEKWQVLDPSGFDIQDLSDVGYDLGAGFGTGAATAAGGVAGLATGPGALASAAGAGAAASGGMDLLRQKIGQWLGVPQEMDYKQAAIQAAAGGVSPVLLGTGASAAKIAASSAAKNMGTEAAKQAQRGYLSKAAENIVKEKLPGMAEMFSGVPKQATQTYAKSYKDVDQLSESGIMEISNSAYDKLRTGLAEAKQKVGQKLEEEISKQVNADGTPKLVNIGEARGKLNEAIKDLETSTIAKNPEVMEKITELKAARDQIFSEVAGVDDKGQQILKPIADEVPAMQAFELQDLLKQSGDLGKIKQGLGSRFKSTDPKAAKEWSEASRQAYNSINEQLSTATAGASKQLKDEYKNYVKLQNNLNTYFSSPEKTYKTLQNIETPNKKYLKETLNELKANTGVDLTEEAKLLEAYKYYNNPSKTPISSTGSTSTSRSIGLNTIGGSIGYKLGGPVGLALGVSLGNTVGSPAAMKMLTKGTAKTGELLTPMARPVYDNVGRFTPASQLSIWNMLQREDRK